MLDSSEFKLCWNMLRIWHWVPDWRNADAESWSLTMLASSEVLIVTVCRTIVPHMYVITMWTWTAAYRWFPLCFCDGFVVAWVAHFHSTRTRKSLIRFRMPASCIRQILGVKFQQKVRNSAVKWTLAWCTSLYVTWGFYADNSAVVAINYYKSSSKLLANHIVFTIN